MHIIIQKIAVLILCISQLNGCAAMFNGTSQQVSIMSKDPNAQIYVNDALLGTGNVVTSFKKKKDYTISVSQKGCKTTLIPVSKSFDATTLLGVFIDFGIVSILVVDGLGTGAWQQFDQDVYRVDANCQ